MKDMTGAVMACSRNVNFCRVPLKRSHDRHCSAATVAQMLEASCRAKVWYPLESF
jgi:hypothetical protein